MRFGVLVKETMWFTRKSWKYMEGSRVRFFLGYPRALTAFLRSD